MREVEDVADVMTSPFRLWARSGAEQINGEHSTCQRPKRTGSIFPCPTEDRTLLDGLVNQ